MTTITGAITEPRARPANEYIILCGGGVGHRGGRLGVSSDASAVSEKAARAPDRSAGADGRYVVAQVEIESKA